jgi:hypothetical protein
VFREVAELNDMSESGRPAWFVLVQPEMEKIALSVSVALNQLNHVRLDDARYPVYTSRINEAKA